MKKHYYLTLDTETCNGFANPLAYDIGFTIHDRKGNIYEKFSFVVREIFFGEWKKMRTAYYADKIPSYYKGLSEGKFVAKSFWEIRRLIFSLMKKYKVKAVIAYNAGFDMNALNSTARYLTKFDKENQTFFKDNTVVWDSWHMACQTILLNKPFFKDAVEHLWISESGNVQTSAEIAFRHIMKDTDFIESHTALEDAIIETAIFAKCVATHKKMNRGIIASPWRIPQPDFKEYYENHVSPLDIFGEV